MSKSPLWRALGNFGQMHTHRHLHFQGLRKTSIETKYELKVDKLGYQPDGGKAFNQKFIFKESPRSFSGSCLVTEEFISPDTSESLVSSSISSSSPGNQESIHLGHHASHFIWQSRRQQKLHSINSCFLKKTLCPLTLEVHG